MNGDRRDADQHQPASTLSGPAPPPVPALEGAEQLYERRRHLGMRVTQRDFDSLPAMGAQTFLERGYRDTALSDITARTGISRMTLRRQFSGKAEFFVAGTGHYACQLHSRPDPLPVGGDIDAALPPIAAHLHARFRRTENIQLPQLMVAQARAFPALAAAVTPLAATTNSWH